MRTRPIRLAIVVSHPIQYCVPLYRSLAKRDDLEIKVFSPGTLRREWNLTQALSASFDGIFR